MSTSLERAHANEVVSSTRGGKPSNYSLPFLPEPQRLASVIRPAGPDARVDVANPKFLTARSSSRRFRQAFDYTQFIFKRTLGWGGFGVALKYEQVDANQQHVAYAAVKVPRAAQYNITEAFEDEMRYYMVGSVAGLQSTFGDAYLRFRRDSKSPNTSHVCCISPRT